MNHLKAVPLKTSDHLKAILLNAQEHALSDHTSGMLFDALAKDGGKSAWAVEHVDMVSNNILVHENIWTPTQQGGSRCVTTLARDVCGRV